MKGWIADLLNLEMYRYVFTFQPALYLFVSPPLCVIYGNQSLDQILHIFWHVLWNTNLAAGGEVGYGMDTEVVKGAYPIPDMYEGDTKGVVVYFLANIDLSSDAIHLRRGIADCEAL